MELQMVAPWLFCVLLCVLFSGYESVVEYEALALKPLTKPPALEPDLSWSYSEGMSQMASEERGGSAEASLYLRLEHRDALSNATAEELFRHRLHRDSSRVGAIGSKSDPVFDPSKSRSYAALSCQSPICRKLDVSGCGRGKSCLYQVSYGDGSFTLGDFSTETLSFRGAKLPAVALGCGHDNEGLFAGAAGLLGLGRGKLSFPSQAGRRYGRKFSYCLVDRTSSSGSRTAASSVIFGPSAIPRSATIYTPMLRNPRLDTFYYVGLVGISVGGARVKGISESDFRVDANGSGGVIIDSGTSVTRLFKPQYEALRDAFRAGAADLKRTTNGVVLFDTCYDLAGKTEVKVPTLVLHFANGANLSLPAANYLIPVDSRGVFCFAFAPTAGMVSIVGNIQQQGFRVVFDVVGSRVGFAPRGCT
ncbi:hypothetical protein H6P81_014377 [Aristolochia fimbriata]|uniref:Peptidase A1 domain-containing protein n=1 Tax=Aristolochia fimbriata TaxID=158543 RepID=A0AAV7EHW5_ARIFI|nr:hypothetical protein H6P81_014377 [Aristolochia fimbriata]